jgi:3-phenylpropionate/trans-cinnamate dioxygenase ferredoxin subunit
MFNYTLSDDTSAEFIEIAPLESLPPGERLFIEVNGIPIVIFNIAGKLFAIGDVCTHDNGPLGDGKVEGNEVICPRHGARFDLLTGKALTLPAVVDIPAYKVQVNGGMIEIKVPG